MKNKLLKSLFLLLICNPCWAKNISVNYENGTLRPLGSGYNSRSDLLLGKCVDIDNLLNEEYPMELATGSFDLKMQKDEKSVADKLGISVSGRYQSGPTTVSAAANFLNESKSNEFSLSYTYIADFQYKQTLMNSKKYPLSVLDGFKTIVGKSEKFFESCGDEYVYASNRAARVFVNIYISFVSKAEKMRFSAQAGVNSPIMDLKANLEKNHDQFSSGNRMIIRVNQIGGDPAKIGRILCPVNHQGKPDPYCEKSSQDVVNCSFGDISKCTNLIASAIAYTNSQDGDNFPSQISGGKNYQVTSLETIPYITLGAPFVRPPTQQNRAVFEASVKQIEEVFRKQYDLWVFANQLINGNAPRLSDRQKMEMEQIQNLHYKNTVHISDSLDRCLDEGVKQCETEVDVVRKVVGIDINGKIQDEQYRAILKLTEPESFVQYCDLGSSEFPKIKKTIDSIANYAVDTAGAENLNLNKGDRCAILSYWLSGQAILNLSDFQKYPIADLAPIATLTQLTDLDLSGQNISSVGDLGKLVNLENLILDSNRIFDLSALSNLKKLNKLSIKDNQITTLDPLSTLNAPSGSLVKIDARGNAANLKCPLSSTVGCKTLSFANYANISSASTKCRESVQHQAIALDDDRVLTTGGIVDSQLSTRMQVIRNSDCRVTDTTLNVARIGHTMTMTKNGILVVGGGTDVIEVIDPQSFSSRIMPSKLSGPITKHTATLLSNGDVLIVGGATNLDPLSGMVAPSGLADLVQIIHTDSTVEVIGRLSMPRSGHTATLMLDGRVLILGGYSLSGMVDIAEVIDVQQKAITVLTQALPTGRVGHVAVRLQNGHIFIAGGFKWDYEVVKDKKVRLQKPISQMVDFDPLTLEFREIEERLEPALGNMQVVSTTDQRVLLIGGQAALLNPGDEQVELRTASSLIQVYDPQTEAIYKAGELLNPLVGFTATSLGQNSVLIFGGRPVYALDAEGRLIKEEMLTSAQLLVYRPR